MRILSIDTATRSGWALSADGVIQSGVFDASIRTKSTKTFEADHPGKRFNMFRNWIHDAIRVGRPDLISYERIVGGRHAGGNTTLIQKGLEAILTMEAYRNPGNNPIPLWNFAAATIKKWATGSGVLTNESKIVVTANAFKHFADQEWVQTSKGPDDNQADALWIMDLTRAVYNDITNKGVIGQDTTDLFDATVWEEDQLTAIARKVTDAKWTAQQ